MQKFKICTVQIVENRNLNFQYHYPASKKVLETDIELMKPVIKRICDVLSQYTNITTEKDIFSAYFKNVNHIKDWMISMDIDRAINKRLNDKERQNLADCSSLIVNILVKYYEI